MNAHAIAIPQTPVRPGRRKITIAVELLQQNLNTREIAAAMGMGRSGVCKLFKRHGIPVGTRGGTGLIGAHISRRRKAEFRRMAEEAGLSEGAYLAQWVNLITSDPAGAKRFAGKAVGKKRGEIKAKGER